MLTEIKVENFKCFKDETIFPIEKLTLLTGVNGKGKSTTIQSLLLPSQSVLENKNSNILVLNSDWVKLGSFDDVKSTGSAARSEIGLSYCFENTERNKYLTLNMKFSRKYIDDDEDVEDEGNLLLKSVEIESNEEGEFQSDSLDIIRGLDESILNSVKSYLVDFSRVSFISAERIGPRSFHESASNRTFGVGKFGEHTASEIYRNREKDVRQELIHSSGETPKLPDQISAWVSYIFNSGTVSVTSISESLKRMLISPDGSANNYKPENVGYGFSYCLPIIVAGLVAKEGDVIIIENPEAHLHPSAQNRITNFLCKVAASNVTTIIETHSPSILNGVRLAVKESVLHNEDTSILFFGESSKEPLSRVVIEKDGLISHWPKGFFDQEEIDLDRLHDL
ncbi:AAA family ATPase [Pseudoalteromonas rhizosphaerae]|uniref:AAA family ATPase n=1 Tax=Pseudoalteromonas rhizosphaerae TaxID=2518973 RepID=UPI002147721F|nr:DUF3696 domain-containing protein [Pseudoalteromonas rhizosphaerae]